MSTHTLHLTLLQSQHNLKLMVSTLLKQSIERMCCSCSLSNTRPFSNARQLILLANLLLIPCKKT